MSPTIIRGDARRLPLPDASVDLIVTSPPYFGLRSYQDGGQRYVGQIGAEPTPREYVATLLECTREWMRVLKSEGSIFVNLGDKYSERTGGKQRSSDGAVGRGRQAGTLPESRGPLEKSLLGLPWMYALGCIYDLGLILRAEIIWDKPTPLPESVTDRVCRSHEQWFHFTRQQRYFANLDAIREPHAAPRRKAGATAFGARNTNIVRTGTGEYSGQNPLGKIPDTVWTIAAQPLRVPEELAVDHDAAFPAEWPRRLILGWAPDGGVVVDPFGGTGTTALVADVLGRRGVSVDRSADYCRLAAWRTTDSGERARALGVPRPPKPMDGQGDLFGAAS
jgi:DNA modification methylase